MCQWSVPSLEDLNHRCYEAHIDSNRSPFHNSLRLDRDDNSVSRFLHLIINKVLYMNSTSSLHGVLTRSVVHWRRWNTFETNANRFEKRDKTSRFEPYDENRPARLTKTKEKTRDNPCITSFAAAWKLFDFNADNRVSIWSRRVLEQHIEDKKRGERKRRNDDSAVLYSLCFIVRKAFVERLLNSDFFWSFDEFD